MPTFVNAPPSPTYSALAKSGADLRKTARQSNGTRGVNGTMGHRNAGTGSYTANYSTLAKAGAAIRKTATLSTGTRGTVLNRMGYFIGVQNTVSMFGVKTPVAPTPITKFKIRRSGTWVPIA